MNKSLNKNSIIVPHCEWSEWSNGACSAVCGTGTRDKTRTKLITNKPPADANGGNCDGQPTKTEDCKDKECPGS